MVEELELQVAEAAVDRALEQRREEMRQRSTEVWGHPGSATQIHPLTIRECIEVALAAVRPDGPDLVEGASGDWDEDGFHLNVKGVDSGEVRFVVRDTESARELLSAVSRLRPWIDEHDRERAAYDAATPSERASVLGLPVRDEAEEARHSGDMLRKARKESA